METTNNAPYTIIGNRPLCSMTEDELAVFIDMTGEYGTKEYWGEPEITYIDRERHEHAITICYTQTRLRDGEKSESLLTFHLNSLTYHSYFMYPYERMNPIRSVLEKPKIFLWLLRQNFNVMELLTEESIPTRNMGCKIKAAGYVLADTCISHGCELLRDDNGDIIVYSNDQAHDAIVKKQQLDETNEYNDYKVYALVEVKETEKHQYKRKNNNKK